MLEHRSLPLRMHARQGRFGAAGTPGVTLSILHPVTLATVIARKGKAAALASKLKTLQQARVMWAGQDQYLVEGIDAKSLKAAVGSLASVVDQSHGRVVFRIAGQKARAVLAKGTPVDLHHDHFPLGKSALTQMAHVGVHLTRTGENEFTLSVFRGFSESFWEWLAGACAEFGYDVA